MLLFLPKVCTTKLLLSLSDFHSTVNSQLLQEDMEAVTSEGIHTGPLRAETHCRSQPPHQMQLSGFRNPKAGTHTLDSSNVPAWYTWGQFSPLEQKQRKKGKKKSHSPKISNQSEGDFDPNPSLPQPSPLYKQEPTRMSGIWHSHIAFLSETRNNAG